MLVMKNEEGNQDALFTDNYSVACKSKMDAECGLGYECELYERVIDEDGIPQYQFLEA